MTVPNLNARITQAGLNAMAAAVASPGGAVAITHVALGRGIAPPATPTAFVGYAPTGTETALRNEFVRRPVGSGSAGAGGQITLQTEFSAITALESGLATELGLFLADGTLFAVHSAPAQPITWLSPAETVVLATSVVFAGVPTGAVTWTATAPDLNILTRGPFMALAAVVAQLQTRVMTDAVAAP